VEFEAIKPADRSFATPGDVFKDLVALDPAVMTHHPGGGVDT